MLNSDEFEAGQHQNAERRRKFVKQWAAYVRSHDDADWSRQQNVLINSQLRSANELAAGEQVDPVRFFELRDRLYDL